MQCNTTVVGPISNTRRSRWRWQSLLWHTMGMAMWGICTKFFFQLGLIMTLGNNILSIFGNVPVPTFYLWISNSPREQLLAYTHHSDIKPSSSTSSASSPYSPSSNAPKCARTITDQVIDIQNADNRAHLWSNNNNLGQNVDSPFSATWLSSTQIIQSTTRTHFQRWSLTKRDIVFYDRIFSFLISKIAFLSIPKMCSNVVR